MNVLIHRVAVATVMLSLMYAYDGRAGEMNGPMSSTRKPDAAVPPATGTATPPGDSNAAFDVEKLFANTCGWCHSGAGRDAGRGPKLMGTTLTDAEIIHRIKVGKPGAMPAFGGAFTDDQIAAIVKYIRGLK
ncbi:MAG TPA: cytochrome c [Casimicrobiaceae bacterium]